jgi:large subunit ribosomal protein L7/L12
MANFKKIGKAWATGGTSLAHDKLKERRGAQSEQQAAELPEPDVIESDEAAAGSFEGTPIEVAQLSASAPLSAVTTSEASVAWDVVLTAAGAKKIQVIKAVQDATGLGLRESKTLVEEASATTPAIVSRALGRADADTLKATLEQAGAVVEVVAAVHAEEPVSRKRSRREKVKDSIARVQVEEGGFGGSFWYLYSDSIETHDGVFPLSKEVTATVDNEVKQQFAPAKLLALGVLGATKKRGEIYLTVEGHSFHCFATVTFRNVKGARNFAAKVNGIARQLPPSQDNAVGPRVEEAVADVTDQIRKLAALRDDGLITTEEFDAKKKQLLGI